MMLDGLAGKLKSPSEYWPRPGGKEDYRPIPRAHAWELAWHLANTDVQFADGIAGLKSKWRIRRGRQAENGSRTGRLV